VVDFKKLLPLLPEPPTGWSADPAEGSTDDLGETQITTVHRDYSKGDGDNVPTTSISILDSVASPEYLESTIAAWNSNTDRRRRLHEVALDRGDAWLRDFRE
jgi:hypothetical protein